MPEGPGLQPEGPGLYVVDRKRPIVGVGDAARSELSLVGGAEPLPGSRPPGWLRALRASGRPVGAGPSRPLGC